MAAFSRASASVVGPCLCRPPVVALTSAAPSRAFTTVNHRQPAPRQSTSYPVRRTRSTGSIQGRRSFHSTRAWAAKDPYTILGVGKDASTSEIKKNYYKLAKQFHPDTNKDPGTKEKFAEISEAWDTLSDDKKRADFDRFGPTSQQPGFDSDAYSRASAGFGGGGFGDFFGGGAGHAQGSDIFESLFGAFGGRGGRASPGQQRHVGENLEASVSIPFLEAAKGTTRTIHITPVVDCHTCTGSGLQAGAKKSNCSACGGSGTRTFTVQGGFQMASTCNVCAGKGQVTPPGSECGSCAGVGKVRERQAVEIKVPPGVDDGMRLQMQGKGDAPLGGKGRAGDLFVRINVQPSKVFTRQGADLYETVNVPFYDAILGGRARVATLDQDVDIKVPGGTQPGEDMVLRGRGIKKLYKNDHGDLIVKFNVTIPRSLTPAQRRILEQFVTETQFPGSSDYAPQKPKVQPAATEQTPASAASAGLDSQASPPPSTSDAGKKAAWWATLEQEEAATAESQRAAQVHAARDGRASRPDTSRHSDAPHAPSSRPYEDEPVYETEPQRAGFLGTLWEGIKYWLPKK